MDFKTFAAALRVGRKEPPTLGGSFLALDPGVTTGWAVLKDDCLVAFGQNRAEELVDAAGIINRLIQEHRPNVVIAEDYRVYGWKQKQHAWSDLYTSRLLGSIELVASMNSVPFVKYPASSAKGFCTDLHLEEWGFYKKGQRHARDAIRHACYYALFGDRTLWQTNPEPRNGPPKSKSTPTRKSPSTTKKRVG